MMAVYIIVLTPEYPVVDQGVGRQGIATLESDHHLQSVLEFPTNVANLRTPRTTRRFVLVNITSIYGTLTALSFDK